VKAMISNGIYTKVQTNMVEKMKTSLPAIIAFLKKSFLPREMEERYK